MAKTKRHHITQTYFKSLRKWFLSQSRRFCCISKVEDYGGSREAESGQHLSKTTMNLKRLIVSSSSPYVSQPGGCGCGGLGEHPVGPAASAHSDLERNDRSPQSSSSSPTLVGATEEVFGLPDCRKTVLGHYHQGSIPSSWKPSKYDGTQCTSTAFTAIVASAYLPVGLWSSSTINRIVRLGDRLHDQIIKTIKPGAHYLAADEMPKRPEDMKYTWPVQCTKSQEYQGLLYPDPTDRVSLKNQLTWELYPGQPLRELDDALERCLEEDDIQGCIITLNYRSSAIFKSPVGEYLVFDSHAKNILGDYDSNGKSSLLRFPSLSQLVTYFRDMTARETKFSLTGFKVEPTS